MKKFPSQNKLILNNYFNEKLISRSLLIIEKLISFLITAFMANRFSLSDIGFWSQALFSASLFTSIVGFNISNGIIAIVPRIKFSDQKYEFIFKSGLFVFILGLIFCLTLTLSKDFVSNFLFNYNLKLNIFLIILIIGFSELLLEFFLYSYRSVKNFSFSNNILFLRILPRIGVFIGIYQNDINLILYLYAGIYLFSCLFISFIIYKSHRINIFLLINNIINNFSLLNPKPYFKSLFLLSKKSVLATITASLFFFLIRSITLSNTGLGGVGKFSLAISAGATILSLTTFIGFTFYPYITNLAIKNKDLAFIKTRKLALKIIFISLSISLILLIIKYTLKSNLDFFPFTINSLDLFLSFLGYGFLGAYQISQPFAFSLTDNVNVFKIEILSSLIAIGLIYLMIIASDFSINIAMLSFCIYTFCNYLQANHRNFKILKGLSH